MVVSAAPLNKVKENSQNIVTPPRHLLDRAMERLILSDKMIGFSTRAGPSGVDREEIPQNCTSGMHVGRDVQTTELSADLGGDEGEDHDAGMLVQGLEASLTKAEWNETADRTRNSDEFTVKDWQEIYALVDTAADS